MLLQLLPFKAVSPSKTIHFSTFWLIVGLCAIVLVLEFSTPPNYVFGYLYVGPILLSNARLNRKATLMITLVAAVSTMLDLWLPGGHEASASTLANRLIAILALMVTGVLSDRNRVYAQKIAQQQAKLHAQEQLASIREDFTSTLTHDLKTPLLGAIETLKAFQQEKFGAVTSAQQRVLATMARSHRNSLQLVETLLDVYRNDTRGLELQLKPVDLVVVAEEALDTLTDLASARQIQIRLGYGDSDFRKSSWVEGDAFQLRRVFTNLITNAINHSVRGSQVEVVLDSQASYQVVKVLDTGLGITAEELPRLFERFYQGDSTRQAKGFGLGLYLTRQIIEAHGGIIWAEDRASGGALFGFRLPAFQQPLAPK
ncbi:MAG: HAMP domain-containing histidine kinase [Chroococcidiopsidaceae cyanobacterium CP_BM_RX_35]|nr:HAMP domain-containing histidine kinase [Chroococcidiopsidaceae cyanobacterium CP_BM_RX_35]